MVEEFFNEDYYKSGNYTDYLQRKGRYVKLGESVIDLLDKLNLAKGPILDFGCAVGFLMEGLVEKGFEVDGVEISEWASSQAKQKGLNVTSSPNFDKEYAVTFALDVLEHMQVEDMNEMISKLKTETLVFRMPVVREGDDDYYLHCARRDPSHIIRWTKQGWKDFFSKKGYLPLDLNLPTIYDSVGVYSGIAIKL
jgi:hypothetical protein